MFPPPESFVWKRGKPFGTQNTFVCTSFSGKTHVINCGPYMYTLISGHNLGAERLVH